jgi:beta-lactamase class A
LSVRQHVRGSRLGAITVLALLGLALSGLALAAPIASARSKPPARKRQTNPFSKAPLHNYLAHRQGHITAVVYDVKTGVSYVYHAGERAQTASIVKVDILATLLHQAQRRGRKLSAAQQGLAQSMIHVSDNDAALDLWYQAGGAGAIGAFDRSIGMTHTAPNVNNYFGLTWTTAADQIKLLRQVMLPGGVLSLSSRQYEYELMRHVTPSQRWGISAGVTGGADVAIKNGWLPEPVGWHVNSIGSVAGSGRHYLIAVLTDHDPSWDYGIDTIQRVSEAAWQALK